MQNLLCLFFIPKPKELKIIIRRKKITMKTMEAMGVLDMVREEEEL